jgi:phosphatidylglycerophosphate synthase
MPRSVNPDHLTILGFLAQLLTGLSYQRAGSNRAWLFAAIGFLALNWFGDSVDGTLARVRGRERPRYGFYVDHMLDSIGSVALLGGLALSGYMSPAIAFALLTAFLLLSIQSYLATYALGEFRMSFWGFGPTELRMLLAAGNLALLRWPRVLNARYLLFDVAGVIGVVGMSAMLVASVGVNTKRLYRAERLQADSGQPA